MGGEGMALRPADARPGFHRPDPPGFPRGGAAAAGAGQQALQRLGVAFLTQEAGQLQRFPVLECYKAFVAGAEATGVGKTDTTTWVSPRDQFRGFSPSCSCCCIPPSDNSRSGSSAGLVFAARGVAARTRRASSPP